MAANVKVLCAVGDFGNGTFNLPLKLNSSSNAQLTISAPIAQNTCYKLAAVYYTETLIEAVTKRIKKKEGMEINKIYNENCLETMAKMPDNFIDLTVTSPPYDDQRKYKGYSFDFENVAKELLRITKQGGVVVWNVNDKRINGSKNLTSFKQAIKFNELGFNIHDIMIWRKPNPMPFIKKDCYTPSFEFMFILSKGTPKTFNAIMEDCKYAGQVLKTHTKNPESIRKKNIDKATKDKKIKSNVWDFIVAGTNYGHPAIFPEQLANDHIISWSNENDLIYDPFMGSGTTAKMAILNNRKYIGSEISKDYCKIIETRIKECGGLFFNSFQTELSNEAGT